MSKRLYTNIVVMLIAIMLSLIAGELFLRYFKQYSIDYALDRFLARGSNFWEGRTGAHRPSKFLGYEPIPKARPEINSYGMFDKEYELKKANGNYRIVVFGDSITATIGGYTDLLEDKLNSSKLVISFEVWNCGVGGYNVEQYVNYLKYKALKYNPDMLIIGLCLNDFTSSIPIVYRSDKNKKWLVEYYNPCSRIGFLLSNFPFRYSYLYRFLIIRLDTILVSKMPFRNINDRVEIGSSSLKKIKEIADRRKIPLIAVIFPYLKPISDYSEAQRKDYEMMVKVLKGLKISYIDLHPYFKETNLYALRMFADDQIHYSIEGHKIIAEIIYKYLLEKELHSG